MPKLTVLPEGITADVPAGISLLEALQGLSLAPDAPCGGQGKCGKCRVLVDGSEALACQTRVDRALRVTLPHRGDLQILRAGTGTGFRMNPVQRGTLLAFDIGTTSVVCFLLDGETGAELACESILNPQTPYGADVISRIRSALSGKLPELTRVIREGMTELIEKVCRSAGMGPEEIGVVSVVGNPCMQQLFLGISPENLSCLPFSPVLTRGDIRDCGAILPICGSAKLLTVPDLAGFIGADTLACLLAAGAPADGEITLLVDIGTNGEMVLSGRNRRIACSTAAGPALEGASIRFGMRGVPGAIDHVKREGFSCSVIGGGPARGICGSGLVDAVACALDLGILNRRGRILTETEAEGQRIIPLDGGIWLTQEDIRQVQMAKGAIRAGIELLCQELGLTPQDIDRVLLAGAFGNYLDIPSACRIGLLPECLEDRIFPMGNAAGTGAKMLACDGNLLRQTEELAANIEFLELAERKAFPRTFAKAMNFREAEL